MPSGPFPSRPSSQARTTPPVTWLSADQVSADFALPPATAPHGRLSLAQAPILVLVGLTGAGKTATVAGLAGRGAVGAVLPARREITDHIILPAMTGDPTRKVTDRIERFRLTGAFRERHPGGMGDVLERLSVDGDRGTALRESGWLVFDGVRGAAETAAAARLPNAVFAVLQAPPELRVARLSLRADPFDQATADGTGGSEHNATDARYRRTLEERGLGELLAAAALDRLAGRLADANAELTAVGSAVSIVVEESRHYDPDAALAVLERLAPARTVVVDTAEHGVDAVVDRVAAALTL